MNELCSKLYEVIGLEKYIYHFTYIDGMEYELYGHQIVCLRDPKIKIDEVKKLSINFVSSYNFVNLLKIYKKYYTIYDNWFNGKRSFEENFIEMLILHLQRNKNFKKIENMMQELKNFDWKYDIEVVKY